MASSFPSRRLPRCCARGSAPRTPFPLACALLCLLLLPTGGAAQDAPSARTAVAACPAPCAGSLSCRLCTLKLQLYREWMAAVDSGVQRFPLPEPLVRTLTPWFPQVDLDVVEVGLTRKQVADGLTDCTRIYLADPITVEDLRSGVLPEGPVLELFLHELVHVEQCLLLGGRDAYALNWFRDLGLGALVLIRRGEGWTDLHGAMPMEADAAARAAVLVQEVEAAASGREP